MLLDKHDQAILKVLQKEGKISNQELAEKVNLSAAPCWRRVKRLEEEGIIQHYVAMLDPTKLALTSLAYLEITLIDHHEETLKLFNQFIEETPEIMECYSVSGQYDYLLRVMCTDTIAFEKFLMNQLLKIGAVKSSNTFFVLKKMKYTTEIPNNHL